MAISLATVGGKITAAFINLIVAQVNRVGLTAVIPTSVAGTGVSLGTNGTVTISAGGTISLNGCFTADFDEYLIILNSPTASTANQLRFRLRAAGADVTTANSYYTQTQYSVTTTAAAGPLTADYWSLGAGVNSGAHMGKITLYNPYVAVPTDGSEQAMDRVSATSVYTLNSAFTQSTASAMDGFTLYTTTGTINGTLKVFGVLK